jgi:hypothetical protein
MQQGRVTLEADWNEAQQVFTEEMRKEALDFVGPSGTPDDGYGVVLYQQPTHPPFDFYIRSGIMYVGGARAELLDPVQYSHQPDWLDYLGDPDWIDLAAVAAGPPVNELVYLLLREQEISAVEDPDLKDVALGGPDTAQRTRLLQRFIRVVCQGASCDAGLSAAEAKWASDGLWFDPGDMRLRSNATLQVQFSGQSQTDPCQPNAQGGYLAPDNQLIRVQISGTDPLTGRPKFLWGFDDASFLYRIDIDPNNPQNLILQSAPVDAYHQPVAGQAVEVLRSAAELHNGGFVAALSGFVVTLDQSYLPDSQSIVLPASVSLPAEFLTSDASPPAQLFLRVWEQEVVFTPGMPTALGDTGLQVTLQNSAAGPFHLGDFWMCAVRPATPQVVYPERYLAWPQPPDGPRLWACPLGVIGWLRQIGTVVADCRNSFCNLVDACNKQQGCCTITVNPQDLNTGRTLQSILYKASRPTVSVQAAFAGAAGNNISVEISNLQAEAAPPVFDLTVTEMDVYTGITVTVLAATIGDESGGPNDGLAHAVANSVNSNLVPLDNQTVAFTGGQAGANARATFRDSANQQTVFTLEARGQGADGNVTTASVTNVSGASPSAAVTFDLTVTWQRTLPAVNIASLFPAIQSSLGYVIVAAPPVTAMPAIPAEGVTPLTGGADAVPGAPAGAAAAQGALFGDPVKICLRPGTYALPAPLVFGSEQSNITIEGCPAATISAEPARAAGFAQGLFQMNGTRNITLRGLTFAMPRVTLSQAGLTLAGLSRDALASIGEAALLDMDTSIGVMATGVTGLTVEECVFEYPQLQQNGVLLGEAISAGGACSAVTLKGNLFHGPAALNTASGAAVSGEHCGGYVQTDTLQSISLGTGGGSVAGGNLVPSTLDNFVVQGNSFENLAFPVYITTAVGAALLEENVVRSSTSGFTLVPLLGSVAAANQGLANDVRTLFLQNAAAQRMVSVATAFPRAAASIAPRQLGAPVPLTTAPSAPAPDAPGGSPPANPLPAPPLPTAAPAPQQPPAVLRLPTLSPLTARLAELVSNIQAAAAFIPDLNFSIQLGSNDIDISQSTGVWALAILDPNTIAGATAFGSLTVTGNKLRNSSSIFTAELMVQFCAVTGNVVMNQAAGGSLAVIVNNGAGANVSSAAITGNVLKGATSLPPRSPASLPDWTTYNCLL